jgi:hypothetical protein
MAAPASSLGVVRACAFENLASIRRRRCALAPRAVRCRGHDRGYGVALASTEFELVT